MFTVNAALAPTSPVADAVTVALPTVAGVKLEIAIPFVGTTGGTGLKEPETPLTENVTAWVEALAVFP